MSVSATSSVQKKQITCQIMYTGTILGTMSVSGFIPGELLIWIKCQCQCQVWTPRNLIWQICAEHGTMSPKTIAWQHPWKKWGFQWKGWRQSVNEGFGEDLYRKGNFSEEVQAIQRTAPESAPIEGDSLYRNVGDLGFWGTNIKSAPDPDTFEKYDNAPPMSIAIPLQKYALLLAECLGTKKALGMAMVKRTFARTIPDNLRAPHMKMWGFEAKRARKFTRASPRTLAWNFITMLSAPLNLSSIYTAKLYQDTARICIATLLQTLTTHTPQIWSVKFAPSIWGVACQKTLILQYLWTSTPEIWGVTTHTPRISGGYGGMGCQGSS